MRVLLQRVTNASVVVGDETVGDIAMGLVILIGVGQADDESIARRLADRVARLRIFGDADGKMNLSLIDVAGEALVVSQFTLYADTTRGRRPSFVAAANPVDAARLIDVFTAALERMGIRTAIGRFGNQMRVRLENDGPVTIWLDTGSRDN